MKDLEKILARLRKSKAVLNAKYGVKDLAVFGSYARNEHHEGSDVDILVTFERPLGVEFVDLALELESILERRVDLVSKQGVKAKYLAEIEPELHYA